MGCTPSIHVSQAGVIYCRESEAGSSATGTSQRATSGGQALQAAHIVQQTVVAGRRASNRLLPDRRQANSQQTEVTAEDAAMPGGSADVYFGPMWLRQHPMSILLVYAKESQQSEYFRTAAEKGGYYITLKRTSEGALESYLDLLHDVVLIDTRHTKHFDAESLCRSIRAIKSSEHTVIIAITKKHDKDDCSVLPLLNAGFNRRIIENSSVNECLNELLCIEHGELRQQVRLRAANALLAAVENTNDPVEITNEDNEIEYVNPAYERLFGYTCEELVGKGLQSFPQSDKNKTDTLDTMAAQLRKGKVWEGAYFGKRKTGETIGHHCKATPVLGQGGSIRHFVNIKHLKNDNSFNNGEITFTNDLFGYRSPGRHKGSIDLQSVSSNEGHRRESITRIHSMTIEAPITKVINIINSAQENSPLMVATALDRVLEILRSSELYSPYFNTQVNDQMTNDLVGGLMASQGIKRKYSQELHLSKAHSVLQSVPHQTAQLENFPKEIKQLLETEERWDFDIITLEKISEKRPLQYLGIKTFERFGVAEFLGCSEQMLYSWLQMIEANYQAKNTYHNSTHAADVLNATAYFLAQTRLKSILEPMDEVAALIAAIVHDLNHPGRTNSYLINAGSELAVLYNDLAVLESHHVSLAFQLTQKDDRVNIFQKLDKDDFRCMRQIIIDMVLATEMTKHFEHLNKFSSIINKPCVGKPEEDGSSVVSQLSGRSATSDLQTPENRVLIKRMLIKCADVSNPLRPLDLCKVWAERIAEEYCQQTDEEKKKGLPVVMPIFDRKTCHIPKSQTSFIEFFINDMFDSWDAFCDIGDLLQTLASNYQFWKEQEEARVAEIEQNQTTTSEEAPAEEGC